MPFRLTLNDATKNTIKNVLAVTDFKGANDEKSPYQRTWEHYIQICYNKNWGSWKLNENKDKYLEKRKDPLYFKDT